MDICKFKVEVEGNGVYENSEHGIVSHGKATIKNNDVFCNQLSALSLMKEANVSVSRIEYSIKC